MIVLPEIAEKLQSILNGYSDALDLEFMVETPGFHLDSIADRSKKRNFIPVFISSLGGQNNPVPLLKQVEGTVPAVFYFPVRFKDKMFAMNEMLNNDLIGKTIHWGDISGDILTNISLPRYGEIQDLDLKQFKSWVEANFQREIEVMEPFITLELSIYLSAVGDDFIYGNNVKITNITVSYNSNTILSDDEPICIDRADIGSSEPASQQLFSDTFTKGFPANAAYTKQLPLIVKNKPGYYDLINICENTKDIQNLRVTLEETIPVVKDNHKLVVTNTYFVTNYSRRTSLGQLLGISLTLANYRGD